jgi:opacity protein-like surface antigen
MKTIVTAASAVAVLLLATGSASAAQAAAPCAGQIQPNPGFERGTTGWTAGPRIVVLGDQARPAHTGRAYAAFAGLDLTHSDQLRTTVTVPAGCNLTVAFWARATTTETLRADYLNVGVSITGTPPKTVHSLAYDHPARWLQHTSSTGTGTTERIATVSFSAYETAGGGVTAFDVDDVTLTLS